MSHHIAKEFSRTYPKRAFGGIKTELVFPQDSEYVCKFPYMLGHYLTLHHHVIYIHFNIFTHLCFKHLGYHSLIRRSSIFQAERYHLVMIIPHGSNKRRFLLIVKGQWYLMVSLESIKETHPRMTYGCIHQLIYPRKGERIFWTDFVQVYEVYTYSPLTVLLLYHYGVNQPLRIKNLLDSPCSLQFNYLLFNSFIMISRWASRSLLSRSDRRVDI